MSVAAGQLDRLIKIERLDTSSTLDSSGRIDRTSAANWLPFDGREGRRWAMLRTQSGREFVRARELYAETTHVFDVRWDSDTKQVTAENRVCLDDVVYEVLAAFEVQEEGMRHELIRLVCKRKD